MRTKQKQPESVADFKQRIARIMRERETGKRYSLVGAAPSDPCVTTDLTTRGKDDNNRI
jgi:hypothetical protein